MNVSSQVHIDLTTFDGEEVAVTIKGETRMCPMKEFDLGDGRKLVIIKGAYGRYETGTKDWPVTLSPRFDPTTGKAWVDADFGFQSRSGKHSKRPTVFFR